MQVSFVTTIGACALQKEEFASGVWVGNHVDRIIGDQCHGFI